MVILATLFRHLSRWRSLRQAERPAGGMRAARSALAATERTRDLLIYR
jgi:hypothetical protein